ncbi:MAG: FAD:protein FMN transferase [Acidobacteria bacterium]|nr:FAD:protein FMN transferase [Acidobacteriota bacterium]
MISARSLATRLHPLLLLGPSLLALAGCEAPRPRLVVFDGETMGTTYTIKIVGTGADDGALRQTRQAIATVLQGVDDLMTTYRPSEVTAFNEHRSLDPMAVSESTRAVVELALDLARATRGALDITVAPLVDAYGFGATTPGDLSAIEALAAIIGFQNLTINASGALVKRHPGLRIDLSALAKGYGVDRVAEALERQGYQDFMVEVGGEVRARGHSESGQTWRIGIERPDAARGTVQRIVPLSDLSLATSGDYRNFRLVDGRRLSHIIDPRTARPIEHRIASATVIHPSCATADGLATAMMVLGEEALELAELNGWAVMLIIRDNGGFVERQSTTFAQLLASALATSS